MYHQNFESWINRKKHQYPDKFDASDLAPQFIPYYENQQRIEVKYGDEIVRGYVGVTPGWKPVFLLMLKSNSIGSRYTLSNKDQILKALPKYRY